MQGLKINECGDQIVPIPIQRNNCIESVRLRKEILVNSAKMQESVQPLQQPDNKTIKQIGGHPENLPQNYLGRRLH